MYFADYIGQMKIIRRQIDQMNMYSAAMNMPMVDPAIPALKLLKAIRRHYGRNNKYRSDGTLDDRVFIGKSYPGQWMEN